MSDFTILGSGFGLYGYLPALIESGENVILPEKYRSILQGRQELAPYINTVRWVTDQSEALDVAEAAAIAYPPVYQAAAVRKCLANNIGIFLLEKPLAGDPSSATALFENLQKAGKNFRIGYLLLHTVWQVEVRRRIKASDKKSLLTVSWQFMAHHFAQALTNWKADDGQGGGILRFYGIHLLALLAFYGYRSVQSSSLHGEQVERPCRWEAFLSGPDLPDCKIVLDSRSVSKHFLISSQTTTLLDLPDPFAAEPAIGDKQDLRIKPLMRLIATLGEENELASVYRVTNGLWQDIEKNSIFHRRLA